MTRSITLHCYMAQKLVTETVNRPPVVERIEVTTALNIWAMCVAGENACPPEDVGGPAGYEMFRQAMADKSHPEFADYWTWSGGPFDPTAFDINLANKRIKKLR